MRRIGTSIFVALVALTGCSILTTSIIPSGAPNTAPSNGAAAVSNPVIVSFTANPSVLRIGQTVALQAQAVSSSGRTLSYTWSATGGTLSTTSGTDVNWTAPSNAGTYTVLLTVTDGAGGSAAGSLNVIVSAAGDVSVGQPSFQNPTPTSGSSGSSNSTGIQWSPVYAAPSGFNDVFFLNSNLGWTAGPGGQVYATTNGGSTWVDKTLTSQNIRTVFFASPNNGWAGGDNGAYFITTDGGNTWKLTDWSGAGTKTINSIVFRDLVNGYMFTNTATYVTADAGLTWTQAFPQGGASGILGPSGKIFFEHLDSGHYWPDALMSISPTGDLITENIGSTGYRTFTVAFPDPATPASGWAAAHDTTYGGGKLYKTTDGGRNWTPINKINLGDHFLTTTGGADRFIPLATGFSSSTDGLVICDDGTFDDNLVSYTTQDGGVTWSQADSAKWNVVPNGSSSDWYTHFQRLYVFDRSHGIAVLSGTTDLNTGRAALGMFRMAPK